MLIDVAHDKEFQAYCDRMEQRLHGEMMPLLATGIVLQVNRGSIPAQTYVEQRGGPMLLRFYKRVYRDQYAAIGKRIIEQKAMRDFLDEQLDWLATEAGKQIVNIAASLVRVIQEKIMDGVRAGKSNDEIAREIRAAAPEISKNRAATIARTETHNSALAAIDATLQYKNIVVKTKTWWSAADSRVRDSHREVHGETIDYDQPFTVGDSQMMRPGDGSMGAGPEEIVNCRCSILFHTEPRQVSPRRSGAQ
jgi:SPP1 gp7 family putative phage head morphogenesis protein